MGRQEYVNDPDAPAPNSLVPAVSAIVTDESGQVLLQRRADNDLWSVPGGTVEAGESVLDALRREVLEETGLEIEPGRLVGVYSDPSYVIAYDDGEVRQQFSLAFACRPTGGALHVSAESVEVRWFAPETIASLEMSAGALRRIQDFLQRHDQPIVD